MSSPIRDAHLEQWEATFAEGIIAKSRRDVPEPWLAGHVHVMRDLPSQPEPAPTGGLDAHQLVIFDAPSAVREFVPGRAPHHDGPVLPGEILITPREINAGELRASWSDALSFTSVMLPPQTVVSACRTIEADYAALEFIEQYGRDPLFSALAHTLRREVEAGGPNGRLYAEELMQTAAVHLVARYTADEPQPTIYTGGLSPKRLRRVTDYVETHLASEIRLADLASEAAMSEYHFARLFKESTGLSPYEYVIRRRLTRAKALLSAPGKDGWPHVSEVAYALGYADPSHLTRQFKKRFGITPSQFQREARR